MKARIYVRVGRAKRWHNGNKDKVAASHRRDDRPLQIGEETLRTLHFAIDVEVPEEVLKDPAMPVVEVQVQTDGTFASEPIVVQAPLEIPATPEEEPVGA